MYCATLLSLIRPTVISDTTHYELFWCVENTWESKPCTPRNHIVRYDDELAIVVERNVSPQGNIEYSPFDAICRLDLPFDVENSTDQCYFDFIDFYVGGEYGATRSIGGDPATGTLKSFYSIAMGVSYLSGIGWFSETGDGCGCQSRLQYARIGGVEYGTPVVSNEPTASHLEPSVRTFPNPADTEVTLQIAVSEPQAVEAHVYDLKGSLIETRSLGFAAGNAEMRHTLNTSTWPSGLYQIRLVGDRGFTATKGIIVIH